MTTAIGPVVLFTSINLKKYKKLILKGIQDSIYLFGLYSVIVFGQAAFTSGISRIGVVDGIQATNSLGFSYVGVLGIALFYYYRPRTFSTKIFYKYAGIIFSIFLFVIGASRGALVILVILILRNIYQIKKKSFNLKKALSFLLIIGLTIYIVNETKSSLFARVTQTQDQMAAETGSAYRLFLWKQAFNAFEQHPVIGSCPEILGGYPHNFILEILMSTGIVGLLIFLIIFNKIKNIFKLVSNSDYYWVIMLFLTGFVFSLFSGGIYDNIMLYSSMGILFKFKRNHLKTYKEVMYE